MQLHEGWFFLRDTYQNPSWAKLLFQVSVHGKKGMCRGGKLEKEKEGRGNEKKKSSQ